jgi:hypothetical protein
MKAMKRKMDEIGGLMKTDIKSETEELRVFIHTLIGELESVDRLAKKYRQDLLLEVDTLARKAAGIESKVVITTNSLENMGEMITCLVENC